MKQLDVKEVMVFLQGNGVSTAYAAMIYKAYGKESIKKVKDNPYCLANDIWGIGFKTADGIASNMCYGKNTPRRCKSGIVYVLNQLSNEGTSMPSASNFLIPPFSSLPPTAILLRKFSTI